MSEAFKYDVFLSHNVQDKGRVRKLAERLRANGLRVWFDEWVIKAGDDIYLQIEHGLEASRALILCMSPAAIGSDWVTLERSTVIFRDPANKQRRFIPLLLEDCRVPDSTRRYKYVDYRMETDQAFQELLTNCQEGAMGDLAEPNAAGSAGIAEASEERSRSLHPNADAQVSESHQPLSGAEHKGGAPKTPLRGKSSRTGVAVVLVCILAVAGFFLWKKYGSSPTVQTSGPIVKVPSSIAFMGANNVPDQPPSHAATPSPQLVMRAEKLATSNPGDARALNDAGVLIQSAGDSQRAGQLLSQAHELAPNDPVIDYNYARCLYEQGRVDDAIQHAQNALAQKSDFDEARVLLADAAIQKKDYATAEDNVSKLRKVIKEIEIAAYTIRGVILLEKRKVPEALAMFQEALKLAGEDPTALYNVGVAQQRGNNLSAAQDSYERALGLDPNFAEAHNNLGTLLMALGKQQAAFDEFHAAAVSDPGNKLIAGNLSATSKQGSEDRIVGNWELEGGQYRLSGTVKGQPVSQTIPVPGGSRVTFAKVASGAYTSHESAMGMQVSTTFLQQPDGSYSAPAVIPEELKHLMPPGVSDTGTVVFWVHGERLFGDTFETVSGPGTMLKGQKTWKAKRVGN